MVLPTDWLFLDRDDVFENESARKRARKLYADVLQAVGAAPEFRCDPGTNNEMPADDEEWWRSVGEVAEEYPRLLLWLTEGQVRAKGLRNVFGSPFAVALRFPGVRKILRVTLFDPVTGVAPWRPALHEAISQEHRHRNRSRPAPGGEPRLDVVVGGVPGLSAVTDVAVIAKTPARDELREKVTRMASGCIGVSGLRGSGKTTLIRDFCAHRYGSPRHPPPKPNELPSLRGLRFVIDAPREFDARDFLIYMYTHLCQTVLTDVRFATAASRGRVLDTFLLSRRFGNRAVPFLAGLAFLALGSLLGYRAVTGAWPALPWKDPFVWVVAGTAASAVATVATLGWQTRRGLKVVRQVTDLPAEAVERLRRLHFQRTDSVARGATVTGPFGIGANVGDSRSLTENVMSLPELIDDYRDFVERVVAALLEAEERAARDRDGGSKASRAAAAADAAAAVRLVIGVDSIDQIEDPAEASKFLDELSAVFGTPHCVYLLAIKPATLAAVDQRTVPLKTSSSGLFDEMVWVEPLTLGQAEELLHRRVTGMPAAFIALCYVLSGGLPRELLRVARAVCGVPGDPGLKNKVPVRSIKLADAATRVIGEEIEALRHRVMASAVSLEVEATPDWLKLVGTGDLLLRWAKCQQAAAGGKDPSDTQSFQKLLAELSNPWGDSRRPQPSAAVSELCDSLIADLYFLYTVSRLFTRESMIGLPELTDSLSASRDEDGGDEDDCSPVYEHVLRNLAKACAALSMDPYLAADHVTAARDGLAGHIADKALTDKIMPPFLGRNAGRGRAPASSSRINSVSRRRPRASLRRG